jgi:hypothetical protein
MSNNQVLWDLRLHGWVIGYRRFESTCRLLLEEFTAHWRQIQHIYFILTETGNVADIIFILLGCYNRRLILTDVSGQHICPIFKRQAVQEESKVQQSYWTAWTLNMGQIAYPETSVTTNTPCVTSKKSEDLKAWNHVTNEAMS